MIKGVKVKNLKKIDDDRGWLMEMLRKDDPDFLGFGQVYITTALPGVVKGWHYHTLQTDNFVCVNGTALVALYDARKDSATYREVNKFILSVKEPKLIQIPNFVYHGFKALEGREASIINCPTELYNYDKPDELRVDAHDNKIPFDWNSGEILS
jgi:dTDP-4-dehydrorhamnose 3,5-epimerase